MTRAFVAVSLPDAVLDAVEATAARLTVPARVSTRDQWHLTLQFLGDRADVDAVGAVLGDLAVPGGSVRLGGAGAFPRAARGTVLWLGVTEGGAILDRLAGAVAERTATLGHEPDTRPYRPHLTLARLRAPIDLRDSIATIGDEPVGPAWRVEAVTVYESRTLHSGARYTPRVTIPLPR